MLRAFKIDFTFAFDCEKRTTTPFSTHCAVTSANAITSCFSCDTNRTAETSTTMLCFMFHDFLLQKFRDQNIRLQRCQCIDKGSFLLTRSFSLIAAWRFAWIEDVECLAILPG
jgi:hypothetical protein